MANSDRPSATRSPFKDLTNTSTRANANASSTGNIGGKPPSRNGWYARMSDEKKADYLEKLRAARQQKKADLVSSKSTTREASGQGWKKENCSKIYIEAQRYFLPP